MRPLRSRAHLVGLLAGSLSFVSDVEAQNWLSTPRTYDDWQGEARLAGDLDADGDIDLVRFNGASSSGIWLSFTVCANDGRGEVVPGATYALPADTGTYVLLADPNGDQRVDLLVATLNSSALGAGLLFFAGQGNGTFAAPTHLPLGGNIAQLEVGHANADGIPDLGVVHFESSPTNWHVRWILGSATGALNAVPGKLIPITSYIGDADILDLDGDGIDDFAISGDASLRFFLTSNAAPVGNGLVFPLVEDFETQFSVLDLDGDGDRELLGLATNGFSALRFSGFRSLGNGAWAPMAPQLFPSTSTGVLHAGDWDADGDADLLLREYSFSGSGYGFYENDGTGVFAQRFTTDTRFIGDAGGVGIFDMDLDGHADFVDARAITFGDGSFGDFYGVRGLGLYRPRDWEGDGDIDLPEERGALRRNDGRGGFQVRAGTWPTPWAPNLFYSNEALLEDFDGDGRNEVLVELFLSFSFPRTPEFVEMRRLRDDGNGNWIDAGLAAPPLQRIPLGALSADADGDGDLDLATSSGLWWNDGTGFFTRSLTVDFQFYTPIAKGDVDADGDLDLLGAQFGGTQSLALLRRTTPGNYAVQVLYPPTTSSTLAQRFALLADLDDDGDLDIAVDRGPSANTITIFANTAGNFALATSFPFPSRTGVSYASAGDLDGDGRTDLALGATDRALILRRVGPGFTFEAPRTFACLTGTPRALADVDQDGDLDLIGSILVQNRRFHGAGLGFTRQYGQSLAGSDGRLPVLGGTGPLRVGFATELRLRAGLGGAPALLIFGATQIALPNFAGFPGLTLYAAPDYGAFPILLGGTAGRAGAGNFDISSTIDPTLAGAVLFAQALIIDPGAANGVSATNGVERNIGF
ncbi:MAG: VCBS repeat-containing protein [Planctomycetes bacterium]|nr:VCBS repeat-containing protein [Planctomycetota bacterium]